MLFKFNHIHEAGPSLHPDHTIEEVFSGVSDIIEDENGFGIVTIQEIYRDGERVAAWPKSTSTGYLSGAWSKFLQVLEDTAITQTSEADQQRITLPPGNMYDAQFTKKRRVSKPVAEDVPGEALISVHERVRTGGNAFQVNLYEVIKMERKNDDLNL